MAGELTSTTDSAPGPVARHGRLPREHLAAAIGKLVGLVLAVVLVSALSISALVAQQVSGNIKTVALPGQETLEAPPPGIGKYPGSFNILFVGSDECVDTGGCPDRTEKLNDFTMLLHVAADHNTAVAVSFPRDLLVSIPQCPKEKGTGKYPAMNSQQINVTLTYGGLPCTVLTVAALTGLDVPFAGIMTFNGVKEISTAIGGVTVCTDGPINDRYTGLNLPSAGEWTLEGEQALDFLRTRHGVGDGSDIGRIGSQQLFLSSMLRKIKSDSTLGDPVKVFQLANAASKNMTLSDSLAQPTTLVSMAMVFKDLPLENITFVQYPSGTSAASPGRVVPIKAQADKLLAKIRADQPFTLEDSTGVGTVADPAAPAAPAPASPAAPATPVAPAPTAAADPAAPTTPPAEVLPGLTGQTAADQTCSKTNN